MDGRGEKRPSVFDEPGNKMGAEITKEDIEGVFPKGDAPKNLDVEGLKGLLRVKALMTEETFAKCPALAGLTAASSIEDVEKALAPIKSAYKTEASALALLEMEVIQKIAMCGMFSVYCCLCTAFTSCCIGPVFVAKYTEELVEVQDADNWANRLNTIYEEKSGV